MKYNNLKFQFLFLSLGILKYKMSYIIGVFSVLCKLGKREVYTKYYYSQRPCIFKVIQEARITNAKETSNLETKSVHRNI